jgi:phosphatidate phosphatase
MDPIRWHRFLLDLGILVVMFAAYLILNNLVDPIKSGFYCNDLSVNLPFNESTVKTIWLYVISLVGSLVFVLMSEIIRALFKLKRPPNQQGQEKATYTLSLMENKKLNAHELAGNVIVNGVYFLFGLLVNSLVTVSVKLSVGRLRPNFLAVCKPPTNPYTTHCSDTQTYIIPGVDFNCTNQAQAEIDEARKSFPSGHASTTFYNIIFLILYLHRVWTNRNMGLLPQLLQVALFMFAVFVSVSRVFDHKHHPSDVVAGASLGTLTALFASYYLDLFFKRYNYRYKYVPVSA